MTDYANDSLNDSENELLGEPHPSIEYVPPRTPHLGHAVFFLAFAFGMVIVMQLAGIGIAHMMPAYRALPFHDLIKLPKITILGEAASYVFVLVLAILYFPFIWHRSFADGISWNIGAVRRKWRWLIPMGVALAMASAGCESLLSIPKDLPVEKFFSSQTDLWLVTILGTLLAPAFEEICFRGFLLPAIAIAWDWLALPRTPEARLRWQSTNAVSMQALVIGAVISSVAFAALHGPQLHWTFGPLCILVGVSLALSLIRIRLSSVAASSLVHASYNGVLLAAAFFQANGYRHLDKLSR